MVEARVVDPAQCGGDALFRIVRDSGATFTGLWLRDASLIIKVARRRKTEQIRVADAKDFDPARSGIEIGGRVDAFLRQGLDLRRASVRRQVARSGGTRGGGSGGDRAGDAPGSASMWVPRLSVILSAASFTRLTVIRFCTQNNV